MRMNRREFLLGLGGMGAIAGLGALSGCAGDAVSPGRELPELTADHMDEPIYELPRGYPIPNGPGNGPTGNGGPPKVIPEPVGPGAVIPRTAWAGGGPIMSRAEAMGGVQLITFHHSGDPDPFLVNDTAGTALHLEGVRRYHIHAVVDRKKPQGAGMWDIAYHYAIDRMGRVWELRNVKYEGQHVYGMNPHNLGVVVLGNFMLQPMTVAQQARVKTFAAALRAQYKVPVTKLWVHREIALQGHGTDCPGKNMFAWFQGERARGGMA